MSVQGRAIIDKTHRLDIEMTVDKNGLLARIGTQCAKDCRRQRQILAIHNVSSKIYELRIHSELFELSIQPMCHCEDIVTAGSITTDPALRQT